jgi:hypothetical protein
MSRINRILIDSRFRTLDSRSTSDFRVEIPESVQMDDNMSCVVCDISLPITWYVVERDVNDKLYFRIYQANGTTYNDYILQMTSRNYNRGEVAEELTTRFAALNVPLSVNEDPFRNLLRIELPAGSALSFMIFTNADLKTKCNDTWLGAYYNTLNPQSINDMIGNSDRSMQKYNVANKFEGGQFSVVPHATLYIVCPQLGTFGNLGPQGERDILKKIIVTADPNMIMYEQYVNIDDYVDVSKLSIRSVNFRLTDVYGNVVDLHGQNWSFTLLFKSI